MTGRVASLWAGIVAAWGASLLVAYLQLPERLMPAAVVASLLGIAGGVLGTLRIRASATEPLITVEDLRRR